MKGYISFFRSFKYAFSGIKYCIKNERNFRFHLVFMIYMLSFLLFGRWFTLSRSDLAILVTACGIVISAEIINTGIENAVNHAKEDITHYAKIAKDAAAGAVLVSVVFAVAVGVIILWQPDALSAMCHYFFDNPLMFLLLLTSLVPSIMWIFNINPFKRK